MTVIETIPRDGAFDDDETTIATMERQFPHRRDVVGAIGIVGVEEAVQPPRPEAWGDTNHPGSLADGQYTEAERAMRRLQGLPISAASTGLRRDS